MTDAAVVVVGAGPSGLTLACGLRAAGIAVRVVDGAPGPASTSRALALQPRGAEVLDRVAALGDLPEHALPVRRLEIFVDGRRLAGLRVDEALRPGERGVLLVSQAEVERRLRERLSALGAAVEWNRRVTGIAPGSNSVTAHFADGSELSAAWLVGADGAHSVVRKAAGIGFPGVPSEERFYLADVRADVARPRDATAAWLRGTGMFAAFPLPGDDLWRLMAAAPPERVGGESADDVVAYLQARLREETGGRVLSTEWTSTFGIHRRLAQAYRSGRVLLTGDAAHIHSPFGGQGMNTGIGDAENLAWKLALVVAGRAEPGLLDTYAAERRPVARQVLGSTGGVTMGAVGRNPLVRLVRDRLVVPLANNALLQRLVIGQASQLRVSYRRGPLGSWRPAVRRPRPGDRIPDRICSHADGSATRLYDQLGPQWALIGPEPLAEAARNRVGELVHLRGDGGEALLIRPDGHLAWRGCDPQSLRGWLDAALGSPAAQNTR
ncbi:FAD-dependent monooxygenase [Mycolicibacter minnesotensis]